MPKFKAEIVLFPKKSLQSLGPRGEQRARKHTSLVATAMAEKITYEGVAPSKEMKDGNGKVASMFMGKMAGQSKTVHRIVIPSGWDVCPCALCSFCPWLIMAQLVRSKHESIFARSLPLAHA